MLKTDFTGKKVLVVGGSSGIGNGIAQAFRHQGAKVHIWGTKTEASAYDGVPGSDLTGLGYSSIDVADSAAVNAAEKPFDKLDVLILCQGIVVYQRGEFEPDNWRRVVDVNLNSLLDCAMKFREDIASSGGSIITVSSVSGLEANIGTPAYAASKAGAISLTKSLGQAWAKDGIRVNGIAPGLVSTKITEVTTRNETRLERALSTIPLGRMGTCEEMASVALFLASPMASYIVGQTIVVDGGYTL
ncbi:MAG: SDR family oxidoreductase [Pseudomonadota bacterium]